jgi:hypothetical protein
VPPPSVDDLRRELRERGYLSHGIERWFALDPWSSRAFWLELLTVAAKASLLVALFSVGPLVAVMLFRNHPLSAAETLLASFLYGVTGFAISLLLLVAIALLLKTRPQFVIDTPRALLAISFAFAALPTAAIAWWWIRFDAPPRSLAEALSALVLIVVFFLVATISASAALLSFSIYELRRVPAISQKPRGAAMSAAAAVLIAVLFLPTYGAQDLRTQAEPPIQVVTTPGDEHVALIAVDGLTEEIFRAHPALSRDFPNAAGSKPSLGATATERWATVGTGVPTPLHGVRAVEGVRLRGGKHLLQAVSNADFVLRRLAEALGLARREPLPPTVRRRDYVWELAAARGVTSVAVNWWTTDDVRAGALESVNQATVFAAAARGGKQRPEQTALRVDATAARMLLAEIDRARPRFATAYLPALDIVLNRLELDTAAKLVQSVRLVDGVDALVSRLRERGYTVVLVGLPGEGQSGNAVVAWTSPLHCCRQDVSPYDVAPSLLQALGFPASKEMPGRGFTAPSETPRIATYGARNTPAAPAKLNEEYYENLKSLGYIR